MMEFVRKPPKGVTIAPYTEGRASWYMVVMVGGRNYYFPVTKEVKRLFGIKIKNGKPRFSSWRSDFDADKALRDAVHALYLQVRDDVCAGIEDHLSQELKEGLAKIYEDSIRKRVESEVDKKMPLLLKREPNTK